MEAARRDSPLKHHELFRGGHCKIKHLSVFTGHHTAKTTLWGCLSFLEQLSTGASNILLALESVNIRLRFSGSSSGCAAKIPALAVVENTAEVWTDTVQSRSNWYWAYPKPDNNIWTVRIQEKWKWLFYKVDWSRQQKNQHFCIVAP